MEIDDIQPVPKPHEVLTFDLEEFSYVFDLAMHASMVKLAARNPSDKSMLLENSDGSVVRLRPTDIPINRAAMAVVEHYRNDHSKYYSMMFRLFALMEILEDKALDRWRREDKDIPEIREIHRAVIDAAATFPLTKRGRFSRPKFLKEVERIASEMDAPQKESDPTMAL